MPKKSYLWISISLLLFAFAVRVFDLKNQELHYDEATNVSIASKPKFFKNIRFGSPGTLFQAQLRTLHSLKPDSAFVWRSTSILASLLGLGIILFFFPKLIGTSSSLFAGAFLAISPFQIEWARAARVYSFTFLLSVLLLYFFLSWLKQREKSNFIGLACVLALIPHIQYGLFIPAIACLVIAGFYSVHNRQRLSEVALLSALFLCSSFVAYFVVLRFQTTYGRGMAYLEPFYYSTSKNFFAFTGKSVFRVLKLESIYLLAPFAILLVLHRRKEKELWPLSALVTLSILGNFVAALLQLYPIGPIRQCMYASPLLVILLAQGVEAIPKKQFSPIVALFFVSVLVWNYSTQKYNRVYNRPPYLNNIVRHFGNLSDAELIMERHAFELYKVGVSASQVTRLPNTFKVFRGGDHACRRFRREIATLENKRRIYVLTTTWFADSGSLSASFQGASPSLVHRESVYGIYKLEGFSWKNCSKN